VIDYGRLTSHPWKRDEIDFSYVPSEFLGHTAYGNREVEWLLET
jgi:hypothetical protein